MCQVSLFLSNSGSYYLALNWNTQPQRMQLRQHEQDVHPSFYQLLKKDHNKKKRTIKEQSDIRYCTTRFQMRRTGPTFKEGSCSMTWKRETPRFGFFFLSCLFLSCTQNERECLWEMQFLGFDPRTGFPLTFWMTHDGRGTRTAQEKEVNRNLIPLWTREDTFSEHFGNW